MLQNGGNLPPKNKSITSLIFISIVSKKLDKFIVISKIELKNFQIYFMLEMFVFKIQIIRTTFKILFIRNSHFSIKIFNVKILASFSLFTFSFNFTIFPFFHQELPNKNIKKKETCWLGKGVNYLMPKFHQIMLFLLLQRKQR